MPTDQVVVITVKCAKCSRQIEIDCEHSPGFGYMNFCAVDCPHCHAADSSAVAGQHRGRAEGRRLLALRWLRLMVQANVGDDGLRGSSGPSAPPAAGPPISPRSSAAPPRAGRAPDTPLVFHRDGIPIRRWRTAWRTACHATVVPTRFLHDCRRTAARNLIRASVPERVAMLLTGHKSRAIFDRYNRY